MSLTRDKGKLEGDKRRKEGGRGDSFCFDTLHLGLVSKYLCAVKIFCFSHQKMSALAFSLFPPVLFGYSPTLLLLLLHSAAGPAHFILHTVKNVCLMRKQKIEVMVARQYVEVF